MPWTPRTFLIDDSTVPVKPPFRAVFLNYLLDCLPAADLKIKGGEVRQLYVRTCLARNLPMAEYTSLTPQDIARKARSGSPADHRALLELYGLFASEYDYRPVKGWSAIDSQLLAEGELFSGDFVFPATKPKINLAAGEFTTLQSASYVTVAPKEPDTHGEKEEIPYLDFAVNFALDRTGHLLHNYGAIRSLEYLLTLIHPNGFILVNDYGQTEITRDEGFEHQRFSHATFVGINFPLLKAYFADQKKCQWAEPKEDSGRIHSRLLGPNLHEETTKLFCQLFSKEANDWLQQPVTLARTTFSMAESKPLWPPIIRPWNGSPTTGS